MKQERPNTELKLEKIFTNGQLKRIMQPEKKWCRWTPEDIASAISLSSVTPKGYRYLRKNGHPLPALSTLRKWAATISVSQGILSDVMVNEGKGMGATNDHPHPIDFVFRLRCHLVGKNSAAIFTENSNTEEQGETCLLDPLECVPREKKIKVPCLTECMLENSEMEKDQILNPESEENTITVHTFIDPQYDMDLSDTSTACMKLLDEFERKDKINDEALK
ncbi:hypothetical protein HHI36_002576 [Cryptolaemus montrouzieri]|uniref:THAP9-like helix-turn-helix domain-containing protein n=1 Tax=Cryptolaemus montrouzieri TaxID=559131 RepID=A0ABD2PAV3_9CUCU